MNWPQKNLFKRLLLFLSIIVFAVLLLAGGLSLYLRKYFQYPRLLELARKYSRQYLNRDISFESFQFNIFKGLVLRNITVFSNPSFRPSASLTVEELSLRYDFKELFSGRIVFSHIALEKLEADLKSAAVQNEIAYYTRRFSSTNRANGETNGQKPSRESRVDLRSVRITGSRIRYSGNAALIRINDLSLKKGKMTRIANDLEVTRSGRTAALRGDLFFYQKSVTINEDVTIPDTGLSLKLQSQTSNFSRFRTSLRARFRGKSFRVEAVHDLGKNELLFPSVTVRDFRDTCFTFQEGSIGLKRPEARFRVSFTLKDFSPEYFQGLIPFPPFPFQADLKADLAVAWDLQKLKIPLVSGSVHLDSLKLTLGTNSFRIQNADLALTKNALQVKQAGLVFNNSSFRFDLFRKDLADPFGDFIIALFSDKAEIPFFPIPGLGRMEASAEWSIAEKRVRIKNFSCEAFSGHVSAGGSISYAGPVQVALEPVLKNVRLEELADLVKLAEKPRGLLQARGHLEFIVMEKKAVFRSISCQLSSDLDYADFKGLSIRAGADYSEEALMLHDGVCVFRGNPIPFKGSADLKKRLLKLSGAGSMDLAALMPDMFRGNLDYSYALSRGFVDPPEQTLTVDFSAPEFFFRQYRLSGLKGDMSVRTNSVRGRAAADNFYSGKIRASLKGDLKEKSYEIESAGERISMAEGVRELIAGTITGRMDYRLNLKIAGTNISGAAELTAVKGEISDTVYQKQLGGVLGTMQKELSDIFYDRIFLPLKIEGSGIRTKKLEILCPDQVHVLSGEVDLRSGTINAQANLKFNEELVKSFPNPALAFLVKKEGSWYLLRTLLFQKETGKDIRARFK